ncbi:MAG: hypothetical protein QM791_06095 [Ferruginibacter sp.]
MQESGEQPLKASHPLLKDFLKGKYSYLAKRPGRATKCEYCIYSGTANPVKYITYPTFKAIEDMMRKEKKTGFLVLDLRKVRGLHGGCGLKKLYKKLQKQKRNGKAKG